jgi:hypothetical protein
MDGLRPELNYECPSDRASRAKEAAEQKKQISLPEVSFWLTIMIAAFAAIGGILLFISSVLFRPLNLGP